MIIDIITTSRETVRNPQKEKKEEMGGGWRRQMPWEEVVARPGKSGTRPLEKKRKEERR